MTVIIERFEKEAGAKLHEEQSVEDVQKSLSATFSWKSIIGKWFLDRKRPGNVWTRVCFRYWSKRSTGGKNGFGCLYFLQNKASEILFAFFFQGQIYLFWVKWGSDHCEGRDLGFCILPEVNFFSIPLRIGTSCRLLDSSSCSHWFTSCYCSPGTHGLEVVGHICRDLLQFPFLGLIL